MKLYVIPMLSIIVMSLTSCNTYVGDVFRYESSLFGVPAPRPIYNATGYKKWTGKIVLIYDEDNGVTKGRKLLGVSKLRPISGKYHFYDDSDTVIPLIDRRGNLVYYSSYLSGKDNQILKGTLCKKFITINAKSYDYVFIVDK